MTIEERFEQLERVNRRWRTVALSLGLVIGAGLIMAQGGANHVADVIQIKRLEVINKKGVAVVTLESDQRGGRILTTTTDGNLLFETGGGEISLYNGQGQKLARLSATKNGEGMLATYNHNGEGVIALGATNDGKGAFTTYNGEGQKLVSISATDHGGAISVWSGAGQAVSTIRTNENGEGEVGAWNQDGKGQKLTPGLVNNTPYPQYGSLKHDETTKGRL